MVIIFKNFLLLDMQVSCLSYTLGWQEVTLFGKNIMNCMFLHFLDAAFANLKTIMIVFYEEAEQWMDEIICKVVNL